jgi:hypothetical protein
VGDRDHRPGRESGGEFPSPFLSRTGEEKAAGANWALPQAGRAFTRAVAMTPHEKAVNAINRRLEELQTALRGAKPEATQQFLVQAIVVTIGMADALTDYAKAVGAYAQRRHAEVKDANARLGEQHGELLNAGKELLERLKANPADKDLRKEIARAQQGMAALQKTVRRSANALQRELAPAMAMIDHMAESLRRLAGAADATALKRILKAMIAHVRELYATHAGLPANDVVLAQEWEKVVTVAIDEAAGFHDAYARAGYQATLALEWMQLAVSEKPPQNAADATRRAHEAVGARLREVTARLTAS